MIDPSRPANLAALRIDQICDQFEQAWKSAGPVGENRPVIEKFIGHPDSSSLLKELLALDIAYRRRVGERPIPSDYQNRFPYALDKLTNLFGDEPAATGDGTGPYVPRSVDLAPRADLQAGDLFAGRFKLREKLGEGGMGIVWVAEQTIPVQRRIALKVIKSSDDSRRLLARFEQERQALALMDHPNIAKVLDAGVGDDGRPYFVMELIKGVPLTKYCDEAKLTPRERLELFTPVCQAVQHAHQKGIIHRDLKPSNILIGLYDGRPVPKVIDFGVAKATGPRLGEQSIYTEVGALIGTLEYMSPEQAELNNLDIDTRSDIYALGVVLYELLTGSVPFSRKELKAAGFGEMLRVIKEVEPPKPSTRLSGSGTLPHVAALRQTDPGKLMRLIRGELDWIVMKCLEKERSRRYETANGLARDIQRYLIDEPVEARPPSARYRFGKFLRRNKGPVVAASLVLLALVAGISGTTWGLFEARRQEQEAKRQELIARNETVEKEQARQAEAERANGERLANLETQKQTAKALEAIAAEKTALAQAQKRLTQIEKANDIVGSIFVNLDPKEIAKAGRPLQAILVEKLDQAVAQLDAESVGDPLVVAAMQKKLGVSLVGLGEAGKAIVLLEKASATFQKMGTEFDKLCAMNDLALAYSHTGKHDLALTLLEEAVKPLRAKFPDNNNTLLCMNNLASQYLYVGKPDQAQTLFEETIKLMKVKFGPDNSHTLLAMSNLASVYSKLGKTDMALSLNEETLKLREAKVGRNDPLTLINLNNLAHDYWVAKRLDKSIPLFEEAVNRQEAMHGRNHRATLVALGNLGVNYKDAGRYKEAIPLLEEAFRAVKKHPEMRPFIKQLLDTYYKSGDYTKDVNLLQEVLSEARIELPKEAPQLGTLLALTARGLMDQMKWTEAESLIRECLVLREKKEPDVWTTFVTYSVLGGILMGQKKYADAEPLLLKGYEGIKQRESKVPLKYKALRLSEAVERLVQMYEATGKQDEAAKWRKELEAIKDKKEMEVIKDKKE